MHQKSFCRPGFSGPAGGSQRGKRGEREGRKGKGPASSSFSHFPALIICVDEFAVMNFFWNKQCPCIITVCQTDGKSRLMVNWAEFYVHIYELLSAFNVLLYASVSVRLRLMPMLLYYSLEEAYTFHSSALSFLLIVAVCIMHFPCMYVYCSTRHYMASTSSYTWHIFSTQCWPLLASD